VTISSFPSARSLILHLKKAREDIEGIPRRSENITFKDFASFVIQEVEDFLQRIIAGTAFDLMMVFLNRGAFDLDHAVPPEQNDF